MILGSPGERCPVSPVARLQFPGTELKPLAPLASLASEACRLQINDLLRTSAATKQTPTNFGDSNFVLSPMFHSHLDPISDLSCKLPLPAALGGADPTAILPLALRPSVTTSSSRDAPRGQSPTSMASWASPSRTLSRLPPRDDDGNGVAPQSWGFRALKRATTRCAPRPRPRDWLPSSVASCHRLQPLLREKRANVIEPCPLFCSWWVDVTRRRVSPSIKRPRSMSAGQPPPSSMFIFAPRGGL